MFFDDMTPLGILIKGTTVTICTIHVNCTASSGVETKALTPYD